MLLSFLLFTKKKGGKKRGEKKKGAARPSVTAYIQTARPCYGNFCWNGTKQGTEGYSAKKKTHQWCVVRYLKTLRCIIAWENRLMYGYDFKICHRCYTHLSDGIKLTYLSIYTHHLIHINSVFREANIQAARCNSDSQECDGLSRLPPTVSIN